MTLKGLFILGFFGGTERNGMQLAECNRTKGKFSFGSVGDQSSPNCSNYSSITGLSVSKENNQILDLQQQLKEKRQRIAELEKDNERLSLENHLAVKCGVKCPSTISSSSEQQVSPPDDLSRLTEDFYSQKLSESNARIQEEQSKILYYDNECRNLLTQLETAKRDADQYQSMSEELTKSLDNAKDETETMQRNYESQIKALSEHVAKLSQNKEESASKKGFFR
uniref:Protein phosphatase 1 regulatory subunit 21 C-terminal domain-containing protein n=1 Tax=Romanomermis culicivorax TaxID=13658 RepID=A0A915KZ94_ROMCU